MILRPLLSVLVCSLFVGQEAMAQVAIGQWRDHLPYRKAITVVEGDGAVYCATRAAIFRYDPNADELERYTKVNLLSDVNITSLGWNTQLHMLIVGYQNGNLDLIRGERTDNLGDIKRSGIVGDKSIYTVRCEGTTAFLGCGFGIVVIDLAQLEVQDTWLIGAAGAQEKVKSIDFYQDSIYAATDRGLFAAWKYEQNLAAYTNWRKRTDIPHAAGPFSAVAHIGDQLLVNFRRNDLNEGDTLYRFDGTWQGVVELYGNRNWNLTVRDDGQRLVIAHKYGVTEHFPDLVLSRNLYSYYGASMQPTMAIPAFNGDIWIADELSGACLHNGDDRGTPVYPNGPKTVTVRRMDMHGGSLYVTTGGVAGNWTNQFLKEGVHHFVDSEWRTTDRTVDPMMEGVNTYGGAVNDPMAVAVDPDDPDHAFVGTWDDGLLEFSGRHVTNIYNAGNSSLLEETGSAEGKVNVAGLDYDQYGNLWMTNANTTAVISVRTTSGTWKRFDPGSILEGNVLVSDILAGNNGVKWIIRPRGNGMLAFNDAGTVTNAGDDQYKLINNFEGQGKLPSNDVLCVAEDKDYQIWVGTGKGVAVFYDPDAVFSGGDFDSQQILIEQDGNVQILLETESVTAIAVDGANRKWFGTVNSGVYLLSPDGTEEVHHFTIDNSPLPSNTIMAITIDELTGEVYIATDQGILSYRSDATDGGSENACASVFPNPVHASYTGPVSITGLMSDSDVKISDVAGNLVYHTTSLGGQAIWPGTNMSGERVATGVYYILATDPLGESKCNAKVLLVR